MIFIHSLCAQLKKVDYRTQLLRMAQDQQLNQNLQSLGP